MNESFAITIMNDIIKSSNSDQDILNRTQSWICMLNANEITKLSYIYLSFIYEELISNNNDDINDIKNTMKDFLFIKPCESDISKYKASIFTFMKYKKQKLYIL